MLRVAVSIDTAAREIAEGNTDLSQRTEQQAASLEETARSHGGVDRQRCGRTPRTPPRANELAIGASDVAIKGGEVVGQVVTP